MTLTFEPAQVRVVSKRFRVSSEPAVSLPNMSLTIQVRLPVGFKVRPSPNVLSPLISLLLFQPFTR